MSLEGFDESIGGKWVLTKNEGFEEYLAAMGNFVMFQYYYSKRI